MSAVRLVDVNGNPISAQAAYDAAMSGHVYINVSSDENPNGQGFFIPILIEVIKTNGEITTVGFSCLNDRMFYAGADPTGGVS